jgi:hypothetical protein
MGTKRATMAWLDDGANHLTAGQVSGRLAAFSYETCIMQTLPGGQTVGNVTHYSTTTSRHQSKVGARMADVRVDNIPRGTKDLAPFVGKAGHVVE